MFDSTRRPLASPIACTPRAVLMGRTAVPAAANAPSRSRSRFASTIGVMRSSASSAAVRDGRFETGMISISRARLPCERRRPDRVGARRRAVTRTGGFGTLGGRRGETPWAARPDGALPPLPAIRPTTIHDAVTAAWPCVALQHDRRRDDLKAGLRDPPRNSPQTPPLEELAPSLPSSSSRIPTRPGARHSPLVSSVALR